MSKTMSPWFPAQIKPIHIGVYETEDVVAWAEGSKCFQYWSGYCWGICSSTKEFAAHPGNAKHRSLFQENSWRGLAKKP